MNKYLVILLNIILGFFILFLLFAITFVNTENIYQNNFGNLYALIYFMYLFIGIIGLVGFRFININNYYIREEVLYTIKSIFLLSIFLIPSFYMVHDFMFEHIGESNLYLRIYGRIAFLYFALTLIVTPVLRFIKNTKFRENLILTRKILGILTFIFFLKHGLEYFSLEFIYQVKYNSMPYLDYVYKNILVRYDALSGLVAGILMLIVGVTSNKISVKLFGGKKWKSVQSLVFPLFLLSIIHIAFASRFDNFYIFLFILVVGTRTISYLSYKEGKKIGKTTKYICVPCGFIYDENFGDPDGGLEPGTKFEDIPNDRYCPVCGVSKEDFEPYYEENTTLFGGYLGEIIGYKMLTEDVLELSLQLDKKIEVIKGQYAILTLKDFDSEFSRAYSIVKVNKNIITFGIKIKDIGRGGRVLKNIKKGLIIKINGIYGEFILQKTINSKVFIATGTGLSPIMNMISEDLKSKNNYLFFGVQKEKDLFYIDEIKKIQNIETHILLSRENVEGYEYGRIDLSKYKFDEKTEFYICGNASMVEGNIKYLKENGFTNIYSEKF